MATYLAGFDSSQVRQLNGFQIVVSNTETGATLTGGAAEISSTVELNETGPQPSDGPRFTGFFGFDPLGMVVYDDLAEGVRRVRSGLTGLLGSGPNFFEWFNQDDSTNDDLSQLRWSEANEFNQSVPEFYSVVVVNRQIPDTAISYMFFGGSITEADDLPPSGEEVQSARLLLNSDEPGDGSYVLTGTADLSINYTTGEVSGTFDLQPGQDSLAQPVTVSIEAQINRDERWIRGDVTSGGTGRVAGAFFGPYGEEIAMSVALESPDGQSFYGDLEARRP